MELLSDSTYSLTWADHQKWKENLALWVILEMEEVMTFQEIETGRGTIREDLGLVRPRRVEGRVMCKLDARTSFSHLLKQVPAGIAQAFLNMDVYPNASSEETQKQIAAYILCKVHYHIHLCRPDHGMAFIIRVREKTVVTIDARHVNNARLLQRYGISEQIAGEGCREEADSCAVCLDEFDEGEIISRTRCGHWFHSGCILEWLPQSLTCPVCRSAHSPPRSKFFHGCYSTHCC